MPPRSLGFTSYDAEGRLAYVDPDIKGRLYSQSTPLMIAVSGSVGGQHVGFVTDFWFYF